MLNTFTDFQILLTTLFFFLAVLGIIFSIFSYSLWPLSFFSLMALLIAVIGIVDYNDMVTTYTDKCSRVSGYVQSMENGLGNQLSCIRDGKLINV